MNRQFLDCAGRVQRRRRFRADKELPKLLVHLARCSGGALAFAFALSWFSHSAAADEVRLPAPEIVARQDGAGFPKTWGTNHGQPVAADYEMDPEVVNAPAYQ